MRSIFEAVLAFFFVPFIFVTLFFKDTKQEAITILKALGEMFSKLMIGSFTNDDKKANKKTRV